MKKPLALVAIAAISVGVVTAAASSLAIDPSSYNVPAQGAVSTVNACAPTTTTVDYAYDADISGGTATKLDSIVLTYSGASCTGHSWVLNVSGGDGAGKYVGTESPTGTVTFAIGKTFASWNPTGLVFTAF